MSSHRLCAPFNNYTSGLVPPPPSTSPTPSPAQYHHQRIVSAGQVGTMERIELQAAKDVDEAFLAVLKEVK